MRLANSRGGCVPPAGKGSAVRLLLLLLPLVTAPALAFDDPFASLPDRDSLQERGWLVAPGFQADLHQGLYHETWPASPHGRQGETDRYTGVRHRLGGGLGLDTGVAQYGFGPAANHYQEYYFGLSYDAWQGKVWYTNDYQGAGTTRAYYELGVSGQLGSDIALSARLAYGDDGLGLAREPQPAYVFSAQKRDLYGFGLNLQLMGGADPQRAESDELRFMGVLSRPLP